MSEKVKLQSRIPSELDAVVGMMAGETGKSAWIEEAIRQRVEREAAGMAEYSDLPPAARERVRQYVELVRTAVRDEELQALERAWEREKDPEYYGLHPFVPSTLDASIDAMIGRGSCRRVPAAAGCA